jgi:tryptophan synthase beta chain
LHQTVIGQEAMKQMEMAGEYPDVVIGCAGGGSNAAGLLFPFLREKLDGRKDTRFLAVEPASCPSLTKGEYRYDFGDTAGLTPLMKMYTLGHTFMPPGIHAGGLRYHAMAPLICQLYDEGWIEHGRIRRTPVSKPRRCSHRRRASFRRRRAPTPSELPSTRRWPRRRRVKARPSSST